VGTLAKLLSAVSLLFLLAAFTACSARVQSTSPASPGLGGRSGASLVEADTVYIVDGKTGRVLTDKNGNQQREVASVQKLVTALVIAEAGNLDKPVTITAHDASCPPTKLPNSVGGTYTRRELLNAMLVLSANDAARALARDNSGSEAAFGAKMTAMARRLGAKNSVFKDSAGFSKSGQYSTAADTVKILRAAYANPALRQANATKFLNWRQANGAVTQLRNSNRVLHRHPNCRGGKVGYTSAAGHCAAIVWEENGRQVFGVALRGHREMFWLQLAVLSKLHANGVL
jgi:D-alanyl-D-alanine carboxypeptidase (penicillin-binding protein 5/6)